MIIGGDIDDIYSQQIKIRQDNLNKFELSDDIIVWKNKEAWCRLVSSVNISGSNDSAQKHILFGGTLGFDEAKGIVGEGGIYVSPASWYTKPGFNQDISEFSTYENTQYGYKPMPHISNVKIDFIGQGTLKYAEIKIKVYSPEQFEIIDQLYMRPGYSILLEWGHNIYLDNKGNKQQFNTFETLPFTKFFNKGTKIEEIYNQLEEERKQHVGNYDGFFGIIMSYNWSFNKDGSYDINVRAVSQGVVIDSLNVGVAKNDNKIEEGKPSIALYKDVSLFNKFLYELIANPEKYPLTSSTSKIHVDKFNMGESSQKWGKETNNQHYITLGALLEYLDKYRNIFNDNKQTIIKYDYTEDNFCLTWPYQISIDPTICLIPGKDPGTGKNIYDNLINYKTDNPYIARSMYILINVNFLFSLLLELRNETTGNIELFTFLSSVLMKINNSLGNQNKLEIYFDSDSNTLKIIDNVPLEYGNFKIKKEVTGLKLYGLGSFVRDLNFNASITKEMASQIAIAASVNGNKPGTNTTSFSSFNQNLEDRIFPTKETIEDNNKDTDPNYTITKNKISIGLYILYNKKSINAELIETLKNLNKEYSSFYLGKNNISSKFFLPFDLSLSLEGISGLKVFNRIEIDENSIRILPLYYRDKNNLPLADVVIKSYSHTISNNKWTTQLTTMLVPINNNPVISSEETQNSTPVTTSPQIIQSIPSSCEEDSKIKLSTNYNLAQLSCKALASKYSIPGEGEIKTHPRGTFTRQQIINNLKAIANDILEPIKQKWPGTLVTSGYRNKGTRSQHEIGEAIDLQFNDITGSLVNQNEKILQRAKDIKQLLTEKGIRWDQFLLEYKTDRGGRPWIHISYTKTGRKEASTFLNDVYASNGRNNFYNPLA